MSLSIQRDYSYYRQALAGERLPAAFIDLDCLDANLDLSSDFPGIRFGVFRSPVDGAGPALTLAADIAARPYLRLDGLMGYEGQIAGLMDDVPGQAMKNRIVRFLKRRSIREINARR